MQNLNRFMEMVCGAFDNSEQCRQEEARGTRIHPRARHIIGICNDRISNLPADFPGFFVIEESYFDLGAQQIEKHYLFLYEETVHGKIRLTSFDVPASIPRASFTNANREMQIDFEQLTVSPRFEPLILDQQDGEFFGENSSLFAPETIFKFSLRVTPRALIVKELLERSGVRVAGYETPIVYIKTP
jgi:hypothetical protein